ncbi:helix-turn-helix domain-containing protein [Thalassococcus sp. S3]|uniref:arsenate reductase/protein-tyrosine-phosphatase family protein n=1 Tax=Thalassococcus sp. S3 TaxID=2017482 RepID=UPI0010247253|nr:helix-turn-helix domain-containing protein [Thalassococcus sp. S3]QBF31761.1 ArsR family transcriptional regulator [Thalassococcus sp. S3]
MELSATQQLGALAHDNRLAIFRLLMRRFPQAVPAGEITRELGIKANTGSVYLSALREAGLVDQRRDGTSLKYSANVSQVQALMTFLLDDCCQSRPDICAPFATETPLSSGQTRPMTALFICTGNSARSLIAEVLLRDEGQGRFEVYSAGTQAVGRPHPKVLELLRNKGHDISGLASKNIEVMSGPDAPAFDFVFTVCDQAANEDCPAWPGQPISAHWGLPDPVKATGTDAEKELAFQENYGSLLNRIQAFVNLPFETLSRVSLQHRVDDIGRMSWT